jgi:hypothetical protein
MSRRGRSLYRFLVEEEGETAVVEGWRQDALLSETMLGRRGPFKFELLLLVPRLRERHTQTYLSSISDRRT